VFEADVSPVAVGVRAADCLPVFVFMNGRLVSAFHAGWRGVVSGIGAAAAEKIKLLSGENSSSIEVIAGPHICMNCFQAGDEIRNKFPAEAVQGKNVNLFKALKLQMSKSGLKAENIKIFKNSGSCTYENSRYASFRKGDRNRMLSFAIQY